jgi:hypothetical protein
MQDEDRQIRASDIRQLKQQVETLETLITQRFLHLETLIEHRFGHLDETKLQHVNQSLNKMNQHIDFIHETYTTLQSPLNYVKNKVERLMGSQSFVELPLPLPLPLPSSLANMQDGTNESSTRLPPPPPPEK